MDISLLESLNGRYGYVRHGYARYGDAGTSLGTAFDRHGTISPLLNGGLLLASRIFPIDSAETGIFE